jgi:hypothetical protein
MESPWPCRPMVSKAPFDSSRVGQWHGRHLYIDSGCENGSSAAAWTDDGVLGVTHDNANLKFSMSAILNANTAGRIALDITVVISNNANDGSSYYYSPYTLTVGGSGGSEEPEIDTNSTETTHRLPQERRLPKPQRLPWPLPNRPCHPLWLHQQWPSRRLLRRRRKTWCPSRHPQRHPSHRHWPTRLLPSRGQ